MSEAVQVELVTSMRQAAAAGNVTDHPAGAVGVPTDIIGRAGPAVAITEPDVVESRSA
jgi:hypothetical protein